MLLQLIINGIIAGSIYALVALGFGLIYGTARFFHFAHGAIYTAGAYFAYTFIVLLRLPLFFSMNLISGYTGLINIIINCDRSSVTG